DRFGIAADLVRDRLRRISYVRELRIRGRLAHRDNAGRINEPEGDLVVAHRERMDPRWFGGDRYPSARILDGTWPAIGPVHDSRRAHRGRGSGVRGRRGRISRPLSAHPRSLKGAGGQGKSDQCNQDTTVNRKDEQWPIRAEGKEDWSRV